MRSSELAYFLSFCIEQYKKAKGLSGAEAMRRLNEAGALTYLQANYGVLHTQSRQWLMEELMGEASEGDIMNIGITQDNLYLILPSKVSWMADMLLTTSM